MCVCDNKAVVMEALVVALIGLSVYTVVGCIFSLVAALILQLVWEKWCIRCCRHREDDCSSLPSHSGDNIEELLRTDILAKGVHTTKKRYKGRGGRMLSEFSIPPCCVCVDSR